ncbi:MAG: AraC family transcriptional regulator [Spirochaetes bacterium]|nr:MAG: AraC family transcriptional regulator [Spirochaetota bacterium]
MNNILNLFAFASICSLVTIAFAYFSEKRKKADMAMVFTFCLLWAIFTLFILSDELGFSGRYPQFLHVNEPFELFMGPLIYYRFRILVEGKMKFNLLTVLLFLPCVLAVIYFIPYFTLSGEEKLACAGFQNIQDGIVRGIYLAIMHGQTPWFVFCLVLFIVHGSRMLSAEGIRMVMQKKVLVAYNLLWIVIAVTGYIISFAGQGVLMRVMVIITNYMIVLFYFVEKKYARLFLLIQEDSTETRYKRSMLGGVNTGAVVERAKELMEREQLYLDEDLSLRALSSRLGITPHQLSEILNGMLHANFRTFLNAYRIDAAKKMLLENENTGVIHIAYQCGFKSKNAFNNAFLTREGMTPTEFIKQRKKPRA